MTILQKLLQAKEITMQVVACLIMHFSKQLQAYSNRYKQTSTQCQSKINTGNWFYGRYRMCWEYNNVLNYQRSQRNYLRFLTENCESTVNAF